MTRTKEIGALNKADLDSRIISFLRFPLAVFVVCIHAASGIPDGVLTNAVSHVLAHTAVPLFYMFSGYLFFGRLDEWDSSIWKGKIRARITSLLVPYIIWITIFLLWANVAVCLHQGLNAVIEWWQSQFSLNMYWASEVWNPDRVDLWGNPSPSTSPALVSMWFIRDLMVSVAMTPLFYAAFSKKPRGKRWIPVVGLLFLICLFLSNTSLIIPGFSIMSMFWFGLGSFLRLNSCSFASICRKYGTLILIFAFLSFVAEVVFDGHNTQIGNYIYPLWIIFGVAAIVLLSSYIIESKQLEWLCGISESLSKTTFFVYAAHLFILPPVSKLLRYAPITDNGIGGFALLFCRVLITVALSVVMYHALKKFAPRFCRILVGR